MTDITKMNELQLREATVPTFHTKEELAAYIEALVTRDHDYGTCVYAMSMAAVAAFNYVASALGVTGMQASLADLDVLRRTRNMERFFVRDVGELLYPQYLHKFDECNAETQIRVHRKWLGQQARKRLADTPRYASPDVVTHWKKLAEEVGDGD